MATIKDVAKMAGVTIGTVSRVLNNKKWVSEDCRKKVLVAIKDAALQAPAPMLPAPAPDALPASAGSSPPSHSVFHSPFFTSVAMEGLEEVAAEH